MLVKDNSERGFLTVDFMLAIIATLGCMMFLLRLSMSLVSVEIAQYIVYASARAHSAADISRDDQKAAGEAKYQELISDIGLVGGFFKVGETLQKSGVIGEYTATYQAESGREGNAESGTPFVGARSEIKLPRLGMKIPMLGKTNPEDNEFKSYVNAMLFREPSQRECQDFYKIQRYEAILRLDGRFGKAGSFGKDYVPMEDSGC